MLQIKHYRRFTNEEQKVLHAIANTVGKVEIGQKPDHITRCYVVVGATDHAVPLAWLVLSFVGVGAAIIVKSFLEAIGSQLGKNFAVRQKQEIERKARSLERAWSATSGCSCI